MHQHAGGDIVGMIILNLEVIDLDGAFEQLVLDFFNNDVFPVDKNQNISRAEVRSVRPALRRTIKRVRRRGNDLLTVDENMRQFIRFIDVGFDNPLQGHVSACLVPCPDEIPNIDLLDWNVHAGISYSKLPLRRRFASTAPMVAVRRVRLFVLSVVPVPE